MDEPSVKIPTKYRGRDPVVFEPRLQHEHTLIVLHGRGDHPNSFGQFFRLSSTSYRGVLHEVLPHTKIIFPSAAMLPLKIANYKQERRQWFDIESLSETTRSEEIQIPGLRESALYLQKIIEEEIKNGIPAEKLVIAGLSQGCATALFLLLTYQPPSSVRSDPLPRLGAVVGMSGWLPFVSRLHNLSILGPNNPIESSSDADVTATATSKMAALSEICQLVSLPSLPKDSRILDTPVFLGHGTLDETIRIQHGSLARDVLRRLGLRVEWKTYEEGHWYTEPDEIDDILAFLQNTVSITVDETGGKASEARANNIADSGLREPPQIEFSL